MTTTKKLFHAIVVIGMAAGAACSSGTTEPPQDASTGSDANKGDANNTKDVAVADTGGNPDASGDGMPAWLGC